MIDGLSGDEGKPFGGGAAARRVDHFETVRRRKVGREIDVSVTISPLRDATGRIVGTSKIPRDITEKKFSRTRPPPALFRVECG